MYLIITPVTTGQMSLTGPYIVGNKGKDNPWGLDPLNRIIALPADPMRYFLIDTVTKYMPLLIS
ncbi:hypothetical protein GCM10028808_70510 [Spirosoma migulaei]